jgi:DNA helicase-2/ATP-dependent DNA helicase PcrA
VTPELEIAIGRLSPTQQQAVDWGEGAALVLAGPGVGKTTVLTTRIARILDNSRNKNFRVLGLTFTTKAAGEMKSRVEALVPGLNQRTLIGTFHAFCTHVLQQHGSHLGVQPDFTIFDQDEDRKDLLHDALIEAKKSDQNISLDAARHLEVIDKLRSRLIGHQKAAKYFPNAKAGEHVAKIYEIYEVAMRNNNIMDFHGMILDACKLFYKIPAVAQRIQQTYPYWLIDEFQDTTPAQYRLIKFMARDTFKNIFVVADDDQIIYQWAGASYKQILAFRENFSPQLIQLVENHRCPPEVVSAANKLVVHNAERTPNKDALVAMRVDDGACIFIHKFATETEEVEGIANAIAKADPRTWGTTVVLGRLRTILKPIYEAMKVKGVKAVLVTRRDQFISPQFVWLHACLGQALRSTDRRVFTVMVDSANRIAGTDFDAALLIAKAEATGQSFMEHWAEALKTCQNEIAAKLADIAMRLIQSRVSWKKIMLETVAWLPETIDRSEGIITDAEEDKLVWENTYNTIRSETGGELELAGFLQGLALRPKEPPPVTDAVCLMTIHAAKGLEFDHVWVMGMAESILPSWQSLKSDAKAAALEEERRNCFVAITRTKKILILSYAERYNGYGKKLSRFFAEMGIAQNEPEKT